MDETKERKLAKKILNIIREMTDDEEKNNKIFNKKISKIIDKYGIYYFVDILLSHQLNEKKAMFILKKLLSSPEKMEYKQIRKDGKNPVQVAIESGYSSDFIIELMYMLVGGFWAWTDIIWSKDNNGNTIMHTLIECCERTNHDVFKIYYYLINEFAFLSKNQAENNEGLTFMHLIYNLLVKRTEPDNEYAMLYTNCEDLRNSLHNTNALYYLNYPVNLLNLLISATNVDDYLEILTFKGDLAENYKNPQNLVKAKQKLKTRKEILSIILQNRDRVDIIKCTEKVLQSDYVDVNYIFEDDEIHNLKDIVNTYFEDEIYKYFEIIINNKNFDKKNLIKILKSVIYNNHSTRISWALGCGINNIYKFYEFLVSYGLNILEEENILLSKPGYYSDESHTCYLSLEKLFYLFQVADFIKTLDLEKYNLKISLESIEKPMDFSNVTDSVLTRLLDKNFETNVDKIYDKTYFGRLITYKLNEMYENSVNINEDNTISGNDILSVFDYFKNLNDDEFNAELIKFNSAIAEENNDLDMNYVNFGVGNVKKICLTYKDNKGNEYRKIR